MAKLQITPEMLEKLRHLIEQTDMSVDAISTEMGMAKATVHQRGVRMGIDMKARFKRIKSKKLNRDKDRLKNPYSKIPDSMTGDGMSLEWLSKRW
jgi:hypothetical protein